MVSKRQRIEASPSSVLDEPVPPPQSYEEADGVYPSHTFDGLTDSMGYFLGEVIYLFVSFYYHAVVIGIVLYMTC